MTYPLLIQASRTPLSYSWKTLKWQQYLKATKPEKWHFSIILFPTITPPWKPLSSPGVKLDLGSVKCLRVWPSPGVACHIQLWAPKRKALAHLFLFSYYSTSTSIKNMSFVEKKKSFRHDCAGFDLGDALTKEVIQMLHSFSHLIPQSPSFLFCSIPQMTFRCRDIPTEMHWLHNLKQQQQKRKQKDEANLPHSLSPSLSESHSGCWSLI